MKKVLLSVVLAGFLGLSIFPFGVLAQTSQNTQALLDQIQALLKRVQDLQNQINQLQVQKLEAATQVSNLVKSLKQGDSGENVKTLQALLAADSDIYPEGLMSGYYGRLTAAAVKRFQTKHSIEAVGVVGPKTLKKLNEVLQKNPVAIEVSSSTGERRPCAIVPPGHLIAPGWLKKNAPPVVPPCQVLPPGILTKLGQATTTPDTTAPVISGIATQNVTVNTATVAWATNELATSKVYYGTSTPLSLGTASMVTDNTLITSHAIGLSGLAATTTYYYVVESKDAAGNTATSTERSFTTTAQADVTAPSITSYSVVPATSSAIISWVTNETADSQVFYDTSTSYGLATPLETPLLTSHSQTLTGLTASTTYYFQIRSRDAALNLGTATGQFTTLALPDTTAPVISAVTATGVNSSSATIVWTTDEPSTSKVFYGTVFPIDTATAAFVSSAALVTSHSIPLTGLNASTTYYYTVQSADANANTATSATSSQQFTTGL
ncbi:MAG: fibronectin type III domain-containing protein [Candidatus Liptonbacteria bacterium]|nr:fibronectin type III domain-containing protein [Candidatus Liptonbacteria bacterium]